MKKALIIIDFVNDFVEDNGKLTCGKPAQDIDANIAKLADNFSKNGDFLVVASDCHSEDDVYNPETKLFPAHCIGWTFGSELYGNTNLSVKKAPPQQLITVDKQRYSAFAGTNLDLKLRERGVKDIYLTGVCTDICVLHTAVDAYNLGYNIFVYENAVASFDSAGHEFALKHFKNVLGATLLS